MQHCFVIDDSDIVRKYARLIFESFDFRVSDSATTVDVPARLQADPAHIILVDWRVPGDDVFDFIGRVRAHQLGVRPYIVYLVTENEARDIQRAFRAGADDYMLKPFNREIAEMKLHEIRVSGAAA